ncbi:type I-C CRISPR-associated protein Cas8c/Csd1 [uncultured Sphingomonas sp.]|uniref:type I-C CRISPR-associated protein Cas8c/Csd1 n=1 Tax=uncultured Sphingomonas sp. TaxID=158754 RepID=UPI00260AC9E1|nr:type I-C CRISPR-associated protein Cas8c/Csd1 [uncultured Sphingomonas sp.]
MTILQALDSYYHRLEGVAEPGWSIEPIGFVIVLARNGEIVDVERWVELTGKKYKPKSELVPKWFGRSGSGSTPFFLWDNTGYALGVSKKAGDKVVRDHAAFRENHLDILKDTDDEGLLALRNFVETWASDQFMEPRFNAEFLDQNVAFRLDSEQRFIHQRPVAKEIIARLASEDTGTEEAFCLVTGDRGPVVRLHPKIKNVAGTAAAEVPLVSFNLDAFTSLGKEQGANAPTSEAAAFRYGTALNHLLTRDGPNRIRRPIGDATVVFWADASEAKAAEAADAWIGTLLGGDISDAAEADKVRAELDGLAKGRPLAELRPAIEPGTRFHVLGLSPNAARLSVRYWQSDDLDQFAHRLADHHHDLKIDPAPLGWGVAPSVNRLLARTTALQEKFENIPPLLAGEVMRAVLTGAPYPQSLLAAAIIRLRAGDNAASGWHAAAIRGVLQRDHRLSGKGKGVPMSLKRDHDNAGYQLGRLFAVYELAQRSALGRVNAGIRDKYFGAASATPASVFPLIVRGGQPHLAKVRKEKPGWAALIERELEEINGRFTPGADASAIWPRSLRLRDQGEFAIGYYHQRATKLTSDKGEELSMGDMPDSPDNQGDEE